MPRSRAEARVRASESAVDSSQPRSATSIAATAEPSYHSVRAQNALVLENIPLVGARKHAEKLRSEVARLQELIDQYGLQDVAALDDLKRHLTRRSMACAG